MLETPKIKQASWDFKSQVCNPIFFSCIYFGYFIGSLNINYTELNSAILNGMSKSKPTNINIIHKDFSFSNGIFTTQQELVTLQTLAFFLNNLYISSIQAVVIFMWFTYELFHSDKSLSFNCFGLRSRLNSDSFPKVFWSLSKLIVNEKMFLNIYIQVRSYFCFNFLQTELCL